MIRQVGENAKRVAGEMWREEGKLKVTAEHLQFKDEASVRTGG